jgi:hypothetical protein
VKANELLGAILLTTVNVAYYQELMAGVRAAITVGNFANFLRADPRMLGARRRGTHGKAFRSSTARDDWRKLRRIKPSGVQPL